MNEQKSFIEEIKNKPELRGLDDQIVISSIEDYKKRHKIKQNQRTFRNTFLDSREN